jgi:hypothetical protein
MLLKTTMYGEQPSLVKTAIEITGRNLAHTYRTADERALVGIDLVNGELVLVRPTMRQVAMILKVPPFRIYLAAKVARDPEKRRLVENGWVRLYKAANGESLADHILRTSHAERLAAAQEVGADTIWDDMVAPLVS